MSPAVVNREQVGFKAVVEYRSSFETIGLIWIVMRDLTWDICVISLCSAQVQFYLPPKQYLAELQFGW